MNDRHDYTREAADWKPFATFVFVCMASFCGFSALIFHLSKRPVPSATPIKAADWLVDNSFDFGASTAADIMVECNGVVSYYKRGKKVKPCETNVFTIEDGGTAKLNGKPLVADNRGTSPSLFPFEFRDNGKTLLTIRDGDEPQGPGCDFGKLVRLAKKHMGANHKDQIFMAYDGQEQEEAELAEQLRVCSPKEGRTR